MGQKRRGGCGEAGPTPGCTAPHAWYLAVSGEGRLGFLELCLHEGRSPLPGGLKTQSLAKLHLEKVTPKAP